MNERDGFGIGRRPDKDFLIKHGWNHYRGKQFRYVYFLCNRREKKRLLAETEYNWNQPFPKDKDISWKKKNLEEGKWYETDNISYIKDAMVKYNKTVLKNRKKITKVKNARKFFDF